MGILSLSEKESKIYGLKLARAKERIENFNDDVFLHEILQGKFDVSKLKISSTIENIFSRLDGMGIPYSIYSIIVRNCKEIGEEDKSFDAGDFSFEQYDGSRKNIFIDLVKSCVIHKTATNYRDSDLSILMPLEKELEALEEYNMAFNNTVNKNLIAWIIKRNEEYIGFVTGEFCGDSFEGIFYGIVKNHRGSRNYAQTIMGFLKKMCLERGIRYFKNDVVLQNFPSLKSIMNESIYPVKTYLNINLKSFFSFSSIEPAMYDLDMDKTGNPYREVLKIAAEQIPEGFKMDSFNYKVAGGKLASGKYRLHVNFPVFRDNDLLSVAKLLGNNGEIRAFAYTRASKF